MFKAVNKMTNILLNTFALHSHKPFMKISINLKNILKAYYSCLTSVIMDLYKTLSLKVNVGIVHPNKPCELLLK